MAYDLSALAIISQTHASVTLQLKLGSRTVIETSTCGARGRSGGKVATDAHPLCTNFQPLDWITSSF